MYTRHLTTAAVCLLAVTAGACAGRVITAPPVPFPAPPPTAAVAVPEEALAVAVLPVRVFRLDELVPPVAAPAPEEPTCDVAAVVAATPDDPVLAAAPLKVGTGLHRYIEVRVDHARTYQDYTKDIALRVLDLDTCTTQVVTVTKTYGTRTLRTPVATRKGTVWKEQKQPAALLQAPAGWNIEVVRRANGIEWNNWATEFRISAPERRVVVGLKYPLVNEARRRGEPRTTELVYVPHSGALDLPTLVDRGPTYARDLAERARARLEANGVGSRAVPGVSVTDVPALASDAFVRRMANEHMDQTEFTLDPFWTTRRIFVVIGANGDRFGTLVCSPAKACGPMQFTKGTYRYIDRLYPAAGLIDDFNAGARDSLNVMQAAILLDDDNLRLLIDAFGADILEDPRLEEYLTAAYNTGVARVINVLRIAKRTGAADWADARGKRCSRVNNYAECLLPETVGYIAKLRYLKEQWPQEHGLAFND